MQKSNGHYTAYLSPNVKGYIFISNIQGHSVEQIKLNGLCDEVDIDLSKEPSGMYLCQLNCIDGTKKTLKVINE